MMIFILTLVASDFPLAPDDLSQVTHHLNTQAISLVGEPTWLKPQKAVDLPLSTKPHTDQIHQIRKMIFNRKIDVFISPTKNRRKKLLLADMDSTIVKGETLDELAKEAGIGDKVVTITEQAMRGEIDFTTALKKRVALLTGHDAVLLQNILHRTKLNPGAESLIRTMAKNGAICVLISGGFTFFTESIAAQVGFHHHHGNLLEIKDGKLTGRVEDPILDKTAKLQCLQRYAETLNLQTNDIMTIGDGANDLPMLQAAGLGIGYRPKPLVLKNLDNHIIHGDLSAALYAQGYNDYCHSN